MTATLPSSDRGRCRPPEFSTTITRSDRTSAVSVRPEGDIDEITALWLCACIDAISDSGERTVEVDLSGGPFIGSAGLRLLARSAERLQGMGGSLAVVGAKPTVRRVLQILELDGLLVAPNDC